MEHSVTAAHHVQPPTSHLLIRRSPSPKESLMTQLFGSSTPLSSSHGGSDSPKRSPGSPHGKSTSSHFPQKIKDFFRNAGNKSNGVNGQEGGERGGQSSGLHSFRFLRGRSTSVSTGNALDQDTVSPTANANPYFVHQGQPALRHHNESSRPPTPGSGGKNQSLLALPTGEGQNAENGAAAGKEEIARKLRRVASAPNAQGLFKSGDKNAQSEPQPPLPSPGAYGTPLTGSIIKTPGGSGSGSPTHPPKGDRKEQLKQEQAVAFRRTYSSNSIKVRDVEVGPGSFEKIKLLGKGDVGKVYLVKEKKSDRLYAMKGESISLTEDPEARILMSAQC